MKIKEQRMKETEFYTYVNVNPKNRICGDCVIRAISDSLNQSWETTVRELTELGIKHGLVLNDKKLYPLYLKLKGYVQYAEPRDVCNRKMTIKEFIIENQLYKCNIICNAGSHHVICIKDGKVHDIWNSSNETIHKFWRKI